MSVLIVTSLGDIVVDLNVELCPNTSRNFLKLCKIKYYNNSEFYKIESDFIARAGNSKIHGNISINDILKKHGISCFKDDELKLEISPRIKHDRSGLIGMVNDISKKSLGSEFYLTLKNDLSYLDNCHVIFGQVEEGHEVLEELRKAITDEDFNPLKKILILHTYILDDPFEDVPEFKKLIPLKSPDEEKCLFEDYNEKDEFEVMNTISKREARSRAITLEILGDIPDADMKPPENVLFVCKLNPVTKDEDLELIFSRFGEIKSCNIIRDYKTNDSLQYAFIEFETKQECELAYLKMQNAIIDDRR